MSDFSYHISRFLRRFPWFLVVAVSISATAVAIALSLPPAYESEVKLIVESQQIPDELARSTVSTPAMEQLQIIEQRLLTRENLLAIANTVPAVRDQEKMTPDEIVLAMRAQTTIKSRSGRDQATVMTITFEAPTGSAAAAVVNRYLTLILEQDVEFRTERAVTTLEFFKQEVEKLSQDIAVKSAEILKFKNANADALPETLTFRMSQQTRLEERLIRLDADITNLRNQREQLIRLAEVSDQLSVTGAAPSGQLGPRQRRLIELRQQLDEALGIYSEQSSQVRQLRAQIAQVEAGLEAESASVATDPDSGLQTGNPVLQIQLAEIDAQTGILVAQKSELEVEIAKLEETIAKTPANVIALEGFERDYENIQGQYNQAVDRLSRASTGERMEFLSRGQRITVIEPPVVPSEPTKPNRRKLAAFGILGGIAAGLGLVLLLEALNSTPRRPEDIVARFEVMPIATIPYVHTRKQLLFDRSIKILVVVVILVGVPAIIYSIHEYYMPLDLVADKVMNRVGVRW